MFFETHCTSKLTETNPSSLSFYVLVCALTWINEVNQHRARLVLRWVTVSGVNSRYETFISLCDQPLRSTQNGHPFVGGRNEYQPKCGDALRLVRMYGWQVKLWPISERLSNGASLL